MLKWIALDKKETEKVITSVKNSGEPALFSAATSEGKFSKLPFYKTTQLYRITNFASLPSFSFDYLGDGKRFYYLDGTFEPLFGHNKSDGFNLTEDNVADYIEFYFHYIKSDEGEIKFLHNAHSHAGLDSLPPSELVDINARDWNSKVSLDAETNTYTVSAIIDYVGSLVRADIQVDSSGRVSIVDHRMMSATDMHADTASL